MGIGTGKCKGAKKQQRRRVGNTEQMRTPAHFQKAGPNRPQLTKIEVPERLRNESQPPSIKSLARELFIFDPLRNDCLYTEPPHLVFLVVLEIAFEPFDMAVAFEGEDVGGDAVEEPAVVADDHGAAGEILERLLERAQRIDVEIVGRLVEQQYVGAGFEHLGEMHAVALAAGELPHLFLLIGALEIERRAIGARIELALAE